ncbi:MAG: 5-formyltetrahydrofolate cyclo-ligase [Xanthomonadales bacterium]|nr:5-formyltetrahydrofolate cyclo-ligase [Xanthomonadales bacterium]
MALFPLEPSLIQQQKKSLRISVRARRRDLAPELRAQQNAALNERLVRRLLELPPCHVSAYLAFDGEPDLAPSFGPLRQAGFRLALPFIEKQGTEPRMVFRHWQANDALSENSLGFAEPAKGKEVPPKDLGVILLPLVAWDSSGARLGMGSGYYDKALESLRNRPVPLRIGIAFELQCSSEIPTDPHDVPLHELISDSQRFTFSV